MRVLIKYVNQVDMVRNRPSNEDLKLVYEMFDCFDTMVEEMNNGNYGVTMDFDLDRIKQLYDPIRVTVSVDGDYNIPIMSIKGRDMRGELEWI